MNSQTKKTKHLQHEKKMSLKERMEESQAYGESFRADHAGADQREAVKPLHEKPSDEKFPSSMPPGLESDDDLDEQTFAENL